MYSRCNRFKEKQLSLSKVSKISHNIMAHGGISFLEFCNFVTTMRIVLLFELMLGTLQTTQKIPCSESTLPANYACSKIGGGKSVFFFNLLNVGAFWQLLNPQIPHFWFCTQKIAFLIWDSIQLSPPFVDLYLAGLRYSTSHYCLGMNQTYSTGLILWCRGVYPTDTLL